MNTDKLAEAAARYKRGDFSGAQRLCNQMLRRDSGNVDVLHLLGIAHLSAGDAAQAIVVLKRGLLYAPAHAVLMESLGLAHLAARQAAAAEGLFRTLIDAGQSHALLHMRLGLALGQQGRTREAEAALRTALEKSAGEPDIYLNLGNVLAAQDRVEEALALLAALLAKWPQHGDAWYNRGSLLQRLRRFEAAADAFARAIRIDPAHADAYNNRGIVLEHLGRLQDAEACYRMALEFSANAVPALTNLGKVLRAQGRLDESARSCERALQSQPDFADAHLNLGSVRAEQGDYEAALAHYQQALQSAPDDAQAHVSHGMLCLALARFDEGWRHYRWRPQRLQARASGTRFDEVLPASLAGKRVLLVGEQGLGDELFFLRYAAALKPLGARLTGLFERMHSHGTVMPDSELRFMIGDLPEVIAGAGIANAWREKLPPPLRLSALPPRVEAMRVRLAALGPPPYTGLTWRAGTPPQDQAGRVDRVLFKTAPVAKLRGALDEISGTLIALQRRPHAGEVDEVSAALQRKLHDLSAVNEDIEDMLALLSLLQEYIGVSNTNMHLMAGLGGAARVLVPHPPDWRWMTAGGASPWFPGFKVYRQSAGGDWSAALRGLANDLAQLRNPRA
jgi:tetratricopeptide (TPR) repeat protein